MLLDLKNSVWFTLGFEDERENIGLHLVLSTTWLVVELKKVLSVTKQRFVFWAQRKPNARLEIYKAF